MPRIIILWIAVCMAVGGFLLLRESPNAREVPFIPKVIALWCDRHYDLRTFVMVLGVAFLPSLALCQRHHLRWKIELGLLFFFLAAETAQIWIPHRRFSWYDMGYSVLGVVAAECLAIVAYGLCRSRSASSDNSPHQLFVEKK